LPESDTVLRICALLPDLFFLVDIRVDSLFIVQFISVTCFKYDVKQYLN